MAKSDFDPETVSSVPREISHPLSFLIFKDLKIRVLIPPSHEDDFDPVIFAWKRPVPDIAFSFGWTAAA